MYVSAFNLMVCTCEKEKLDASTIVPRFRRQVEGSFTSGGENLLNQPMESGALMVVRERVLVAAAAKETTNDASIGAFLLLVVMETRGGGPATK